MNTFALACQARYYEDLGYPGHVNCTDNFNGELERFEIAPRKGWAALNFFYNTGLRPQPAARVRRAVVASRGLCDVARLH